jgi:hypothetical protein
MPGGMCVDSNALSGGHWRVQLHCESANATVLPHPWPRGKFYRISLILPHDAYDAPLNPYLRSRKDHWLHFGIRGL